MADVASLSVRISADISDMQKNLSKMQRNIKSAFGSNALNFSKGIVTGMGVAAGAFGLLGGAAIKAAADMEMTRTAFTQMLKSGEKAEAFIKDLQKFAAETPFGFEEVKGAAQKFLAFGFTAEQVIPVLTAVGDAAAGLGMGQDGIDRLTLALGQMAAKGKVSGEEMRQLAEAGIPAWDMLAQKMGVSIPEAMDQVSKGAVNAQVGLDALVGGMKNRFGGMMDQMSNTLPGLWATLEDNAGMALIAIGENLVETFGIKDALRSLGDATTEFTTTLQSSGMAAALRTLIPPELEMAIYGVAAALTIAAIPAVVNFGLTLSVNALAGINAFRAGLTLLGQGVTGVVGMLGTAVGMLGTARAQFQLFTTLISGLTVGATGLSGALAVVRTGFTLLMASLGPVGLAFAAISIAITAFVASGGSVTTIFNRMGLSSKSLQTTIDLLKMAWEHLKGTLLLVIDVALLVLKPFVAIAAVLGGALLYGIAGILKVLQLLINGLLILFNVLNDVAMIIQEGVISAIGNFGNYLDGLTNGALSSTINKVKEAVDWFLTLIGVMNKVSELSGNVGVAKSLSGMVDAIKGDSKELDFSNFGGGGTTDKKGKGKKSGADKLQREIDRINEKLSDMKEKTREIGYEFEKFKLDQAFGDLEGASAVYGQIEKERLDAIYRLQDEQKKLAQAEKDAQELYNRAVKAGNEDQIASTKALWDETAQARISAAEYAAQRELEINNQAQENMTKASTEQAAIRAQLDLAYREGNTAAYMQTLTDENAAFLTHLEEKQALMQQHYDWRMEAESTILSFQLKAMETLKNGLASAFADAIVNGEDLIGTIKDLGKQIVSMFIQWQVQRMLASVFSKMMGKKDVAATSAQSAAMAEALAPPAWLKLVLTPSAGGVATSILTAGVSAAVGIGAASNVASSIGEETQQVDAKFANGGIVTRPTVGLIGEKPGNPEGVFPLKKLDQYFSGAGGTSVTVANYGDINDGTDMDSFLEMIGDAVQNARRGR